MNKQAWIVCMILGLTGCAGRMHHSANEPLDLRKIERISLKSVEQKKQEEQKHLRLDAVRDTAMSLGARGGLAWRTKQINQSLLKRESYLNQIFNFNSLLLDKQVIPPVLVESKNALNLETPQSIRVADTSYRIIKQARFVTVPPVWRDYLITNVKSPEMPDPTLLPKDRDERAVWVKYTREGWRKGVEQANQIYVENLNRLKRDFQGMIRYRTLLAKNMVSSPVVAERDLGVTGGGEELSVNDRVMTIQALPALKADSSQWHPKVAH